MKTDPSSKEARDKSAIGFLKVTQQMAQRRAGQLAELKGRYACDVTEADLVQACHELVGEADPHV